MAALIARRRRILNVRQDAPTAEAEHARLSLATAGYRWTSSCDRMAVLPHVGVKRKARGTQLPYTRRCLNVGDKVRLLLWWQRRDTKITVKANGLKHADDLLGFWMKSLKGAPAYSRFPAARQPDEPQRSIG